CGLAFNAVAPRMIMGEFAEQFAGQDRDSLDAHLGEMRRHGYRACVVCLRALGAFERHEWGTRLLAVGAAALPTLGVDERLFSNVLFFRDVDSDFLPSLFDWLEQSRKWL